jgi:hypothetical protein
MLRYLVLGGLAFGLWVVYELAAAWPTLVLFLLVLALLGALLQRRGYPILVRLFTLVNRFVPWHRLPLPLAILNLDAFRFALRQKNLYGTPKRPDLPPLSRTPGATCFRANDGSFNDLGDPDMGRAGMRFGRNVPLRDGYPDEASLLDPNPREVSRRLLARETFAPATTLNLLAAAWIQFQVHDWMNHVRSDEEFHEIPISADDDWPEAERPMRVAKNVKSSEATAECPPTYVNTESHWWDQSQIYGDDEAAQRALRTGERGKLKLVALRVGGQEDLRLEPNPTPGLEGVDHTGVFDNYWVGLSILHTLFTREHNAICDRLAVEYPAWDDDRLFATARLVNCALTAKIHTVEWTPGILAHPVLQVSMRANWWGLLGENVKKSLGRLSDTEELSGVIGSATDHHTAPYAMTEEFTAVYRMHPLIPDRIAVHSSATGAFLKEESFTEVQGRYTRPFMQDVTIADLLYSFGIAHPGAIRLHNFPDALRRFEREMLGQPPLDLAAVDVLRDRERGVPRYNAFRRLLHKPPARRFSDISSNPVWAREMAEVYGGDIEKVDLLVGLLAEDLPEGFGFSDTAFRVFILMATRRLKSDRFFTRDYTPETYTRIGLDWIDDNGMASVLVRHYPQLAPALHGVANPFAPWSHLHGTNAP